MTPSEMLVKSVGEAWGNADMQPLLNALDDEIVWKSGTANETGQLRFGGDYRGRVEVLELFSQLATTYSFLKCTAKEIISGGEIIWALFEADVTFIPQAGAQRDSRVRTLELAFRCRVRNGKILEAQTFFDTAPLLT